MPPTVCFESLFNLFTFSEEVEEVPVGEAGSSDMMCQVDGASVFGGVTVALVARNVLASTAHGDIVGTAHMEVLVANSRPEKFQTMIADMTRLDNMDAVKYSTFLVFDFKADAT